MKPQVALILTLNSGVIPEALTYTVDLEQKEIVPTEFPIDNERTLAKLRETLEAAHRRRQDVPICVANFPAPGGQLRTKISSLSSTNTTIERFKRSAMQTGNPYLLYRCNQDRYLYCHVCNITKLLMSAVTVKKEK